MLWARAKSGRDPYKMSSQSWTDHGLSCFVTVFLTNVIIFSGKTDNSSRFVTILNCIWPWSTCMRIFQIEDACVFFSISDKIRWIFDRFRQISPKSRVNGDVAVFWLHFYNFWSSGYFPRFASVRLVVASIPLPPDGALPSYFPQIPVRPSMSLPYRSPPPRQSKL